MSLDLKKVNLSESSENGYEFEVKLPEIGTPTGAFIKTRGVNSPKVQSFMKRQFNANQMKETIAKRKKKDVDPMTIEEIEEYAVETAVMRTIGWRGITEDGKEVPFSVENATRVYTENAWIRDAVIEESNLVGNFLE